MPDFRIEHKSVADTVKNRIADRIAAGGSAYDRALAALIRESEWYGGGYDLQRQREAELKEWLAEIREGERYEH